MAMTDMDDGRDAEVNRVIELARGMSAADRRRLADYAIEQGGLTFVPALPVTDIIASKRLSEG